MRFVLISSLAVVVLMTDAAIAQQSQSPSGLTVVYTAMGRRLLLDPPSADIRKTVFTTMHSMSNATSDFVVKYCGRPQTWVRHEPVKEFEKAYREQYLFWLKSMKDEPRQEACQEAVKSIESGMDRFNTQFAFYAKPQG